MRELMTEQQAVQSGDRRATAGSNQREACLGEVWPYHAGKIWDQHVIARLSDDTDLLHVDRHLLHDLGGSRGLLDLKSRGLSVHNPELTFATPDHAISTAQGRVGTIKIGQELLAALRTETSASGIQMFDIDEPAGYRSCHRARTASQPARLLDRMWRQPYVHPRRPGCAGLRHRFKRVDPCAGDAGAHPASAKTMRVRFEGKLSLGVTPRT